MARNAAQWDTCRSALECLGGLWKRSKCLVYCLFLLLLLIWWHLASFIMGVNWRMQMKMSRQLLSQMCIVASTSVSWWCDWGMMEKVKSAFYFNRHLLKKHQLLDAKKSSRDVFDILAPSGRSDLRNQGGSGLGITRRGRCQPLHIPRCQWTLHNKLNPEVRGME